MQPSSPVQENKPLLPYTSQDPKLMPLNPGKGQAPAYNYQAWNRVMGDFVLYIANPSVAWFKSSTVLQQLQQLVLVLQP